MPAGFEVFHQIAVGFEFQLAQVTRERTNIGMETHMTMDITYGPTSAAAQIAGVTKRKKGSGAQG